jgi:hypothetical protein
LRRVLEARRPVESVRKEQIWKENKLRHNCQGFYRNFAKTMKTELRRATEQEYYSKIQRSFGEYSMCIQELIETCVYNLEIRFLSQYKCRRKMICFTIIYHS